MDPITAGPSVAPKRTSEFRFTPDIEYQFGGDEFDSILSVSTGFNYKIELKHNLKLEPEHDAILKAGIRAARRLIASR